MKPAWKGLRTVPGTNTGRVVCAWAVAVTVTAPSGNISSSGSTQVYLILYLELGPHGAQRNERSSEGLTGWWDKT